MCLFSYVTTIVFGDVTHTHIDTLPDTKRRRQRGAHLGSLHGGKERRKGSVHWFAAKNLVFLTNQWSIMYTVFAFSHPFKTKLVFFFIFTPLLRPSFCLITLLLRQSFCLSPFLLRQSFCFFTPFPRKSLPLFTPRKTVLQQWKWNVSPQEEKHLPCLDLTAHSVKKPPVYFKVVAQPWNLAWRCPLGIQRFVLVYQPQ